MSQSLPSLTSLQIRVAREIVGIARRAHFLAGEPLPELVLAKQIGTSRTPVQIALKHLAHLGVVTQDQNRRYVLARDARELDDVASGLAATPDDPLYLRIAQARQSQQLADEISESELMRHFDVARSTLKKVLARISEEGWIEQRVGSGWAFLPMIDSHEAYEESYYFRQSIEPQAIQSPGFTVDRDALVALRREQRFIVDKGYLTMTPIELFEANSRFHETLANWSHNRFFAQAVKRLNQQRRLVEYRQAAHRPARQTQAIEHLNILQALDDGKRRDAATLMRRHLDQARRAKLADPGLFGAKAPAPGGE